MENTTKDVKTAKTTKKKAKEVEKPREPKEPKKAKKAKEVEEATEEELEEVKEEALKEEAEAEAVEEAEEKPEELEEEAEEVEKPEKKELEEEIVEEKIYTIPLGRARVSPRKKRTPRAIRLLQSYIQRHMKIGAKTKGEEEEEEAGKLVISNEVNEKIWGRGIEKPPRNIRVRAVKDKEGIITVYLAEGD